MLWYQVCHDPQVHPKIKSVLVSPHGKWDFKKSYLSHSYDSLHNKHTKKSENSKLSSHT